MGKLDELGDAVRQTIRAFHGSPYDFNKFDASKIGTGEGAQSYGYGHYLAENENVAKRYRDMREGELTIEEEGELTGVLKRMRELKLLAKEVGESDPRRVSMIDEWARLRSRREFLEERPGRMYEVEVGLPEDALLNYDAPISQQPMAIRNNSALLEMAADEARNNALQATTQGRHDHWWNLANNPSQAPASLAVQAGRHRRPVGAGRPPMGPEQFSEYLFESGIPGIRYLDQGSRSAGEGTRNYVIFPGAEDSIRILRKYGMMAPIAAGAMDTDGQ
jgi:hypothetical protein